MCNTSDDVSWAVTEKLYVLYKASDNHGLFSYYWKMLMCHTRRVTMFIKLLLKEKKNVSYKASDNVY